MFVASLDRSSFAVAAKIFLAAAQTRLQLGRVLKVDNACRCLRMKLCRSRGASVNDEAAAWRGLLFD